MIIIFNFIRQFRHDHQRAVAQSCISKIVQTYYIWTESSLHLSFCLSFCFCLFLVVASVFVFAEGGTNQGEGNISVFVFVSSSFSLYLQKVAQTNHIWIAPSAVAHWYLHLNIEGCTYFWPKADEIRIVFVKNCCPWRIALLFSFFLDDPVFHHPINKETLHQGYIKSLLEEYSFQ